MQLKKTAGRLAFIFTLVGASNAFADVFTLNDAIYQTLTTHPEILTVKSEANAAENDVNVDELARLASETGGEYQRVEDEQLADLYQNIQLGVRFQYEVETVELSSGDVVGLNIAAADGVSVSRNLTVQ